MMAAVTESYMKSSRTFTSTHSSERDCSLYLEIFPGFLLSFFHKMWSLIYFMGNARSGILVPISFRSFLFGQRLQLSHIGEISPPPSPSSSPPSPSPPAFSLMAQIPASRPKSKPPGPNPSLQAQIPALRPKSQPRSPNPSLKAQIPASRPKSQP